MAVNVGYNSLESFDKLLIFTSHLYPIYGHMKKSRGLSKFSKVMIIGMILHYM